MRIFKPTLASLRQRAKKTDSLLAQFIRTRRAETKILAAGIDSAMRAKGAAEAEILEALRLQETNSKLL